MDSAPIIAVKEIAEKGGGFPGFVGLHLIGNTFLKPGPVFVPKYIRHAPDLFAFAVVQAEVLGWVPGVFPDGHIGNNLLAGLGTLDDDVIVRLNIPATQGVESPGHDAFIIPFTIFEAGGIALGFSLVFPGHGFRAFIITNGPEFPGTGHPVLVRFA